MPCPCWDHIPAFVHILAVLLNILLTASGPGKQSHIPKPFNLTSSWETQKKLVGDYRCLSLKFLCFLSAPTCKYNRSEVLARPGSGGDCLGHWLGALSRLLQSHQVPRVIFIGSFRIDRRLTNLVYSSISSLKPLRSGLRLRNVFYMPEVRCLLKARER